MMTTKSDAEAQERSTRLRIERWLREIVFGTILLGSTQALTSRSIQRLEDRIGHMTLVLCEINATPSTIPARRTFAECVREMERTNDHGSSPTFQFSLPSPGGGN